MREREALVSIAEAIIALRYAIENAGELPPGIDAGMEQIIAEFAPLPTRHPDYVTGSQGELRAWFVEPDGLHGYFLDTNGLQAWVALPVVPHPRARASQDTESGT